MINRKKLRLVLRYYLAFSTNTNYEWVGVNSHSMSWPAGIGPGLYKQIVVFGNLRVQKFLGPLLRVHTFLLKKTELSGVNFDRFTKIFLSIFCIFGNWNGFILNILSSFAGNGDITFWQEFCSTPGSKVYHYKKTKDLLLVHCEKKILQKGDTNIKSEHFDVCK